MNQLKIFTKMIRHDINWFSNKFQTKYDQLYSGEQATSMNKKYVIVLLIWFEEASI